MKTCVINYGHTLTGGDIGARGLKGLKEEVLTREVGINLMNIFKKEGIKVTESYLDHAETLSQSLSKQVDMCNATKSDLNICIHFNAFNQSSANGSEIYTYQGKKLVEAERVLTEFNKLGFTNRGIKNKPLALVNQTISKTIYIEVCFITSPKDVGLLEKHGTTGIAEAITGVC